ncbi:hypothetical protein ABPG75_000868 [Micractinium tetrahymenae]
MAGRDLSAVEAALHKDCVSSLAAAIQQLGLTIHGFYDWSTKQGARQRNLLSMAAAACSPACVAALLHAGAQPNAASPSDGNTALHCACSSASCNTARIIALLVRAGADKLLPNHAGRTARDLLTLETSQVAAAAAEPPPPEEAGDLLRPEFSTDEFRMFSFKIDCCPRLAESHDWTLCPFQHPGEKARRRDPRCFKYQGVPCPDFRKGTCKRGDACTYAHGVFECWLHPSRYRTQLCKEGAACRRSVCFFAHAVDQLREPTKTGESAESHSPRGPLLPAEESQDTPRSWSPAPASSEDSVKLLSSSAESLPKGVTASMPAPPRYQQPYRQGLGLPGSSESSLSSTPVLEGSLAASLATSDSLSLHRTLSSLSLSSENMSQMVALQHATASGLPSHAALLAATAAAGGWPLQQADALTLAAQGAGPLAAGLHSMLLPNAAALQAAVQAAAMQQQLAMLHATDTSSLLGAVADSSAAGYMAEAGVRQPLHPLSLNLGGFGHAQLEHHSAAATCFSGGF